MFDLSHMDHFCEAFCLFWSLREVTNSFYLEKMSMSWLFLCMYM